MLALKVYTKHLFVTNNVPITESPSYPAQRSL